MSVKLKDRQDRLNGAGKEGREEQGGFTNLQVLLDSIFISSFFLFSFIQLYASPQATFKSLWHVLPSFSHGTYFEQHLSKLQMCVCFIGLLI